MNYLFLGKRTAAKLIGRIQGFSFYKKIFFFIRCRVEIDYASREDMIKLFPNQYSLGNHTEHSSSYEIWNFTAKKKDNIVGFIQLVKRNKTSYPYDGFWIHSLHVNTFFRGLGIGRDLVRHVIRKTEEENAQKTILLVGEKNEKAIELYRKMGFQLTVIRSLEDKLEKETMLRGSRRIAMIKISAQRS